MRLTGDQRGSWHLVALGALLSSTNCVPLLPFSYQPRKMAEPCSKADPCAAIYPFDAMLSTSMTGSNASLIAFFPSTIACSGKLTTMAPLAAFAASEPSTWPWRVRRSPPGRQSWLPGLSQDSLIRISTISCEVVACPLLISCLARSRMDFVHPTFSDSSCNVDWMTGIAEAERRADVSSERRWPGSGFGV